MLGVSITRAAATGGNPGNLMGAVVLHLISFADQINSNCNSNSNNKTSTLCACFLSFD